MKNINLIFILCININLIKTILDTNPKIAVFPFKTYHFPNRANTEQFSSKDFMDIIHNLFFIASYNFKYLLLFLFKTFISIVIEGKLDILNLFIFNLLLFLEYFSYLF